MLNFVCKAIASGRAFLRRLINLTTGVSKSGHHIKSNSEARADLEAWFCFLSSHNGISMFIGSKGVSLDYIKRQTDAGSTQGCVVMFGSRWLNGKFPHI